MNPLPYKISVLVYAHDDAGRLLLLHRLKAPNRDLYSPPGGKLDMTTGESPADCALREIHEELQLSLTVDDIRLAGLVSETAYGGKTHWLMFLYEIRQPVQIQRMEFEEGRLEWHDPAQIDQLNIPQTDRQVIYPLLARYAGGFFAVHINCNASGLIDWQLQDALTGNHDDQTGGGN